MGLIVVGDILECRAYSYTPAQLAVNTWHWRCQTNAGLTEEDVVSYLALFGGDFFRACLSSTAEMQGFSVRRAFPYADATAAKLQATDPTRRNGQRGVSMMPTQVCGMISLRGTAVGSAGRGRMYLPFPSTGDAKPDGTPTLAYRTVVQVLGDWLLTTGKIVTGNLGANGTFDPFTLPRNKAPLPTPPPIRLTSKFYPQKFGTQRKRGAYGRVNSPFV